MNHDDLFSLLPLLVLAGSAVLVLFGLAFSKRRYETAFALSMAGLIAAALSLGLAWPLAPRRFTALLVLDRFAYLSMALTIAATIVVALMSFAYFRGRREESGEFYFLLQLACLGCAILGSSSSFASFFLGLELLSTPLFTLIGYRRDREAGVRSAFMYLILAGVSSAFLLFGMALVYLETGSLDISAAARAASAGQGFAVLAGLALMTVGIGFKLAVAPFHVWTPDIYDGAPAPATAFIATASKGAMAVLLVRFFAPAGIASVGPFAWIFALIAAVSMFTGNILALREGNLKRLLAYSSIAHLGYILVAFVASGSAAGAAVSFYLVAYFVSNLGAFAAVSGLSTDASEADSIESYRGLAARHPWTAAALTASLLSLAGLPLTAGFMGKFVIFAAGAGALLWVLIVILAVNSTISIFYYLRVVSALYRPAPEAGPGSARPGLPALAALALGAMAVAIIVIGVLPDSLIAFVREVAATL
ncbi:MAG TPA: NADH-quinone oxidoreductase subunit N [Rectinemataceae bacterium]|nr:NADH-quinone oxidoreductase subunit N [Rectinemataceae bacterium]